jgi:hypothetical protein
MYGRDGREVGATEQVAASQDRGGDEVVPSVRGLPSEKAKVELSSLPPPIRSLRPVRSGAYAGNPGRHVLTRSTILPFIRPSSARA